METYTFKTKNKRFQITVKKEFLKECPNPEDYMSLDLNKDFYMFKYLHNETGPAVIRFKKDDLDTVERSEFWLDGSLLEKDNPELDAQMKQKYSFNKKLTELINE